MAIKMIYTSVAWSTLYSESNLNAYITFESHAEVQNIDCDMNVNFYWKSRLYGKTIFVNQLFSSILRKLFCISVSKNFYVNHWYIQFCLIQQIYLIEFMIGFTTKFTFILRNEISFFSYQGQILNSFYKLKLLFSYCAMSSANF